MWIKIQNETDHGALELTNLGLMHKEKMLFYSSFMLVKILRERRKLRTETVAVIENAGKDTKKKVYKIEKRQNERGKKEENLQIPFHK